MQLRLAEVTAEWRKGLPDDALPTFRSEVWPQLNGEASEVDRIIIRHRSRGWGALKSVLDIRRSWTVLDPPHMLESPQRKRLGEMASFDCTVFFRQSVDAAIRTSRLWRYWPMQQARSLDGLGIPGPEHAEILRLAREQSGDRLILTFLGEGQTALWFGDAAMIDRLAREHGGYLVPQEPAG